MCTELLREFHFFNASFLLQMAALTVLTLVVLFGNALVILAVLCSRSLRSSVTSCLILSLAVADLCVGALVLPFSTAHQTLGFWIFGSVWCQVWLAIDVWMCTASIYNLVAISVDRFIAVSRPLAYAILITPARGWLMIAAVWTLSFAVCFPPMISWPMLSDWYIAHSASASDVDDDDQATQHSIVKRNASLLDTDQLADIDMKQACTCTPMNNTAGYIVYSALMSFYIPMIAIGVIYVRIYLTAKEVSESISNGYIRVSRRKTRVSTPNSGTEQDIAGFRTPLVKQRTSGSSSECQVVPFWRHNDSGCKPLSKHPPPLHGGDLRSVSQNSYSNYNSPSQLPEDGLRIHYGKGRGRASMSTLSIASKSSRPRGSECSSTCSGATSLANSTAGNSSGTTTTAVLKSLKLESWCDILVRTSLVHRRQNNGNFARCTSSPPLSPTPGGMTPEGQSRPPSRATVHKLGFKASHSQLGDSSSSRNSVEEALQTIKAEAAAFRNSQAWNRTQRLLALVNRRAKYGDNAANCTRTIQRREIRAAKTVAIVTGCFIVSWLGFAVIYLLQAFPFCQGAQSCIPSVLFSLTFWLGYVNSALNPIIYALFSKPFRRSFKRLLCLKRMSKKQLSHSWDYHVTSDCVG